VQSCESYKSFIFMMLSLACINVEGVGLPSSRCELTIVRINAVG
jgi:hypothetical protein